MASDLILPVDSKRVGMNPSLDHSDNVDEETNRIRLALDTVYATAIPTTTTTQGSTVFGDNNNNNNTFQQQRQLANQYLTSFQSTAIAWVVCDRLLWESTTTTSTTSPTTTTTTTTTGFVTAEYSMKKEQRQFFAAQTLHTKCRSDRDVAQLLQHHHQGGEPNNYPSPSSSTTTVLASLRDSLLQHLNRSIGEATNTALTMRLAMSISALAVQMGWTTILKDLLLSGSNTTTTTTHTNNPLGILILLQALPEECASPRLILIQEDFRYAMRDHFIDTSPQVFAFLLHHLSLHTTNIQNNSNQAMSFRTLRRVLEAWHSWIRYVPVRPHVIAESPLLPATVELILVASTSSSSSTTTTPWMEFVEQATDVIVEILRMYPTRGPPDNFVLIHKMMSLVFGLPLPQILTAAAQKHQRDELDHEDDLDSKDGDLVRDYCRIITEMGESYLSWILGTTHQSADQDAAFHLIDWILLCSSLIADREVAAITLSFWYRMVMELEETEPLEWRQDLIDQYSSRLLQLISVCANNLMKFPHDISEIAIDQVEEINRHRFHVSETVEDCCRLLGGQVVLHQIEQLLQEQIAGKTDSYYQHRQEQWQGLESCLACLVAIHKFVSEDENRLLPFVFGLLIPELAQQQQQQSALPKPLRFTVSRVVGKFARWLAVRAASNPDWITCVLSFLAQGLAIPECAPAVAVSIKELCAESNPQSFALAQSVLELYEQVMVAAAVVAENSERQQQHPPPSVPLLELRDELELLEGVCLALSKHIVLDTSGSSNGTVFLQRLVQPLGTRLEANSRSPTATPRTILPDIQRVAVVVQHLKVFMELGPASSSQHPIVELMWSLWPILETLIIRFPHDVNTAEHICRLHKHALRSCGPVAYLPLLERLQTHLVESYRRSHQSPFLYAASICVSEYGTKNQNSSLTTVLGNKNDLLFRTVEAMCEISFSFLRNWDDFNNHPDVVEELFYLMERMVNHCPDTLGTNPQMLQSLVRAAVLGMALDHHGANKGTVKFLDGLASHTLDLVQTPPPAPDRNGNQKQQQQQQQNHRAVMEQVLGQEGGAMTENLIRALVGDLPAYSPKQIPELLWKLHRLSGPVLFTQWLSMGSTFSELPDNVKNEFLASMAVTGMTREDFFVAVRSFQNHFRFRRPPRSD